MMASRRKARMVPSCLGARIRPFRIATACLLALLACPALLMAQEAPPGATTCLGCHSPERAGAAIASLRGRDAADVVEAMRAFREGRRPATLMDRLAKGFSDTETQAIAAWIVR